MKQALPVKLAFKLRGIVKKIAEETDKYDTVRKDLIEKYGKKDENGKLLVAEDQVQFDQDGMKGFVSEINELLTVDVELATINIGDLSEAVSLSTEDLIVLEGLLVE